jgi:uncharacterized membrane protein YkvA (DUF1232 family)
VKFHCMTLPAQWRQQAERLQKEAQVFYFVFKHPCMPWYGKLIAAATAAYLLSPVQLIPSFIPVIGFLDDLLVLFVGVKLLRSIIPRDVLAECRERAAAAEMRRNQEIHSSLALAGLLAIAALWLLAAVTASTLIAGYLQRKWKM